MDKFKKGDRVRHNPSAGTGTGTVQGYDRYGKVILRFDARNADYGGEGTGDFVDESELILLTVGDEDLLNLLAGLEAYINAEPDDDDE